MVSYFGVQSLSSDVKSLAEPLVLERRPIVCFAGEATSEQYFSTTHGARSSGIREAERLINYYNPLTRNKSWFTADQSQCQNKTQY
jgi:hypothetical protein